MAEKIIKHRLFTWFEEVPSQVHPDETVLTERIAHLGQKVDITNDAYIKRGEELDAFFSDEEAAAIENGTFSTPGSGVADAVARMRSGVRPAQVAEQDVAGEGAIDVNSASAEDIADYIEDNKLNVDNTVALAGDDEDSIEKVIDAENLATNNDPRKGVIDRLEAKLAAAAQAKA